MDWEGGFINDSINEEPHQVTGAVSVGVGDDKNKAIVAVSVSQIAKLTRPNEGLIIHGKKIYHVNLVARVYEIIDINPQKIHILVDDYTSGGPLEVTHIIGDIGTPDENPDYSMYNANDEPNQEQQRSLHSIQMGDYLSIIGVVKFNQDKTNLVAYNIKFIDDPNDVTCHCLEVVRDSMYFQRLQSGSLPKTTNVGGAAPLAKQQQQTDQSFGRLTNREKHVLKFLKEKAPEGGMRIDDIVAQFKAMSRKDIEESLETLSSEGQCWQGDSEDTWCVAAD